MKKIILVMLLILCSSFYISAQETKEPNWKEVGTDKGLTVFIDTVNYENNTELTIFTLKVVKTEASWNISGFIAECVRPRWAKLFSLEIFAVGYETQNWTTFLTKKYEKVAKDSLTDKAISIACSWEKTQKQN